MSPLVSATFGVRTAIVATRTSGFDIQHGVYYQCFIATAALYCTVLSSRHGTDRQIADGWIAALPNACDGLEYKNRYAQKKRFWSGGRGVGPEAGSESTVERICTHLFAGKETITGEIKPTQTVQMWHTTHPETPCLLGT